MPEILIAFLDGSTFGLPLHVGLDTDRSVDLRLDGEVTGLGELSRPSSRARWLRYTSAR